MKMGTILVFLDISLNKGIFAGPKILGNTIVKQFVYKNFIADKLSSS